MNQRGVALGLVVGMVLLSCGSFASPKPTSSLPPGWNLELTDLLVPSDALPVGWRLDLLGHALRNPPVNNVAATWSREGAPAKVVQTLWRAFSVSEAKLIFGELESHYAVKPQIPDHSYTAPMPREKIEVEDLHAGDYRLVCRLGIRKYCVYIGRYGNYVVNIWIPLQTENADRSGEVPNGLTTEQVEKLIDAVDAQFQDFLE